MTQLPSRNKNNKLKTIYIEFLICGTFFEKKPAAAKKKSF